ncbi:hypothetical protein BIV57_06945 [Mangrovactinospora gilvigrisea]|uniref:UspA domain-containing protein n=1 Tax=Mangrovactinospora gilvigrisea TaxID=1428644 RepID=A0A1J7CER7_9ACTN|nr:universal stress protein [Mangrovactinospora gilvigrisea]OIV38178.1 hypothetical protein BIV57_06945 [Mangrovactinospora gilvigrisea]
MADPQLPLVVGVDGSESASLAAVWAATEARLHAAPLRLVHAAGWRSHPSLAPDYPQGGLISRARAESVLASAAHRARRAAELLEPEVESVPEDAVAALVREARTARLLVLGAPRPGRRLRPGTAPAVAARAACPVVVVRGTEAGGGAGGAGRRQQRTGLPVVLAVGPDPVPEAVEFAFAEAAARGAEVRVEAVHAWRAPMNPPMADPAAWYLSARADDPAVEAMRRRALRTLDEALRPAAARHPGVAVLRRAVEGPTRRVLLDASTGAALLVLGARWRRGPLTRQLGPRIHAALHHARCPVVIVPEG